MPRILILHASVGSGHKRAAEALALAFRSRQQGQVWVEDTLDYATLLFRQTYTRTYLELSDRAPALWGSVYYGTDQPEAPVVRDLRALVNRIGVHGLNRLIRRRQPEAIVCTHFLPVQLLSGRKGRARLPQPLYCVVTDYTAHAFWAYRDVDGYFVAGDEVRDLLAEREVPPAIVYATGIPIDPAISTPKDGAAVRRSRSLGEGPLVTFFGGGIAVERVRLAVEGLLRSGLRGTLLVVAGRNAALQKALRGLEGRAGLRFGVLGFINYVDDLVAASDLVITKPGGLIVSEVLGRGTPLLLVEPIPGQEDWNADFVSGRGAGIALRLIDTLPVVVSHLLADGERLALLRTRAAAAGKPHAALDIADHVLRDLAGGAYDVAISDQPHEGG